MPRNPRAQKRKRGNAWRILRYGTRVYRPSQAKSFFRIVYLDPRLGRVERTARSEREAMAIADEAEQFLASGCITPDMPVNVLARRFVCDLGAMGRTQSYVAKVEGHLRLYVMPGLGDKSVVEWTVTDSRQILAEASRRGLAPATVKCLGQTMRGLVSHAQSIGVLGPGSDPMFGVKYGVKSSLQGVAEEFIAPEEIPSAEEVEMLARAFKKTDWPEWGLAVRLCSQSGLRWGELIALTPDDIDLDKRLVHIRRSVGQVGNLHLKVPKNGKARVSLFFESLSELLSTRCAEVRLKGCSDLLFPGPGGTFAERSAFRRGRFIPAARVAGWPFVRPDVPRYNWISLRHYAATVMLFELRLDLADVALFLGHADPAFTLRTYVDSRRNVLSRAFDATRGR